MKRLATAILLAACAAAQAATVRMSHTARARSEKITLADLAVVEGAGAADAARMSGVVVAFIEKGAESAEVTPETVRAALGAAGFNLADILITGAACARVSRADAAGSQRRTMMSAVENHLAAAAPEARFAVSNLEIDFKPPEGFVPVVRALHPGAAAGPARFDIADAADPLAVKGHAFATLAKSVKVVTTSRRVLTGHLMTDEDLQTAYLSEGQADGCCRSVSQVIGRRARFKLAAGAPIPAGAVECDDVVKRGDEITLAITVKSMTVSMKTTALEGGAVGDVVRLRRVQGRTEHLARVTGPGRAEPLAGGAE